MRPGSSRAGAGAEAPEGRARSKWRPAGRGGAVPAALSARGPSRAGLCRTTPSRAGPGAPRSPQSPSGPAGAERGVEAAGGRALGPEDGRAGGAAAAGRGADR